MILLSKELEEIDLAFLASAITFCSDTSSTAEQQQVK